MLPALGLPVDHDYMSFVETQWEGLPVMVCAPATPASGATSSCPPGTPPAPCGTPCSRRSPPRADCRAGLGARDTLRTEMGYPLHGNDLSPDITPVMAGAAWAVGWDKERFWGREALRGRAGGQGAAG